MIRLLRVAEIRGGLEAVVGMLARPAAEVAPEVAERVRAILDDVRRRGDAAIVELTKPFDGVALEPDGLAVGEAEWAGATLAPDLAGTLAEVARRIEAFHRHQVRRSWWVWDEHGSLLGQQVTPLDRVSFFSVATRPRWSATTWRDRATCCRPARPRGSPPGSRWRTS